jgi:zinc/manganese transport system ATP-binding protein
MSSSLQLQDISAFTPDGRLLFEKVSFELKTGQILLIEGSNGSGKTTLVKVILGSHPYYQGHIRNDFPDATYLPQLGNVQFFLPLTVLDIIQLQAPDATSESVFNLGLLTDRHSLSRPWNTASGGERQKALLTRAFLNSAHMRILDEPFNHLDQAARRRLVELIKKENSSGCAVLLISHEQISEFENTNKISIAAPSGAV